MITRRQLLAGTATGSVLLLAACTIGDPTPDTPDGTTGPAPSPTPTLDPDLHHVLSQAPRSDMVLTPDAAGALAASQALLTMATAVVVLGPVPEPSATASPEPNASAEASASPEPTASGTASPSASPEPSPTPDPATTAAEVARTLGVPLFVDAPELAAELDRLETRTVIAYGEPTHIGDREVIAGPASASTVDLPGLPAQPGDEPALAIVNGDLPDTLAVTLAAAGVAPDVLTGTHPGATAESTQRVRAFDGPLVAIGDGFGTDDQFAGIVKVTRKGPELAGGGVAPFPLRTMVALYGHPESGALGMLGEQPPAESVARVNRLVEEYRALKPDHAFMGAFEIITTVASASAESDDSYSRRTPIETLLPLIEAAEENDIYVVLDLQPGRVHFLDQAKEYEELLLRPHVGLALDPEWRLKPDQRHLRQIGQVHVDEVNEVGAWLADLVQEHELPPKVLILHQFQTRMIVDRQNLDVSRPEIQYLMHVDGQGGQGAKQGTWRVLKEDLPPRVWVGWKNFEDEDIPMLTPQQTLDQVEPLPQFISYQ